MKIEIIEKEKKMMDEYWIIDERLRFQSLNWNFELNQFQPYELKYTFSSDETLNP